jgi:hypothetical protein
MAQIVLTDASILINSVDYSSMAHQVKINYLREQKESTAFGMASKARKGGLFDWSIEVEIWNDFAVGVCDGLLYALVGVQTALIIRPVKGTVIGTSNPEYRGNGMLEAWSPLGTAIGDLVTVTAKFNGSDGVALTRNTV